MNEKLWKQSVFSDGTELFLSKSCPKIGEEVTIAIRILKDSPIKRIYIRYLQNGEETVKEMSLSDIDGELLYYKCKIVINQNTIQYHFIMESSDNLYFYNQKGIYDHFISEKYDFKILADFQKPTWVEDSIFYQIFPERFYNGNEQNDVVDDEYSFNGFSTCKRPWESAPGKYEQYGNLDFYGGDLEGIKKKIYYLKAMGVNAIYINPIFSALSTHKYDCIDYFNVDKHFGGNEALRSLTKVLHDEDMKLVVDISINHTGNKHKWFIENMPYYFRDEHGKYECWCGVETLPVLNYENADLRDVMYKDNNSILKKWLKEPYSIDGWRFDVGHNVGKMKTSYLYRQIWREIRQELKSLDSDIYLLAEHWGDSSEYLQGDMWDGTMNYFGFERPARKYLGERDTHLGWKIKGNMKKKNSRVFMEEVIEHYASIPYELSKLQLNLLGSHDIHRIGNSEEISKNNLKCGIIMLFTFLGVPCIYYGDEVGLKGGRGEDSNFRYPMEWNEKKWNKEIYDFYKYMISLRKNEKVLVHGSFKFIDISEDILCYVRFDKKKAILFLNSQSKNEKKIEIPVNVIGSFMKAELLLEKENSIELKGNLKLTICPEQTLLIKLY